MESFADEVEDGTLKEMVDKVTEKMIKEANKCIPKKKVGNGNKPYWDEELTELRKNRDKCRKESSGNHVEWHDRNEQLKERMIEKKKSWWRGYVEELREGDDGKVWKAIKSLSTGDKGQSSKEVLNAGGRCYTTDRGYL